MEPLGHRGFREGNSVRFRYRKKEAKEDSFIFGTIERFRDEETAIVDTGGFRMPVPLKDLEKVT